jgi:CheY-like chemotaxis protein
MNGPQGKTILVVDDEEDIREFLSTVLRDAGFDVVTAADGEEALQQVEAIAPDFISVDLVMPRKTGLEFLYELRERPEWKGIPVMVVTSHAHDDMGKKDFEDIFSGKKLTGPQFHLEKPVDPDEYLRLICRQLAITCDEQPSETVHADLRSELHRLIDDADPSELGKLLELLKSRM